MTLSGTRRYVGFGFGAIQAGLFLYEAYTSERFAKLTVAEVMPQVVDSLRQSGGVFGLNIAQMDHIDQVQIGPIQIENPNQADNRQRLVQAIAEADEIGTAVPSVAYYVSDGPASLHRVLADGLRQKAARDQARAVIYTAENNNHAAEILEAAVMAEIPRAEQPAVREKIRFLNTVIGKMSGVITDKVEIQSQDLIEAIPGSERAYLVEAFNHILISRVDFPAPPFERGISVFEEKPDLLPFEEAKLYGHNAAHALIAYIGAILNLRWMAEVQSIPGAFAFLEGALIEESGAALIHKYAAFDPSFTPTVYQQSAHILLERMVNPYLRDRVERIGRDPVRKLGWDDRLIGAMRLILKEGFRPYRYAFGTAAALVAIDPSILTSTVSADEQLLLLWGDTQRDATEEEQILAWTNRGLSALRRWAADGYPNLQDFYRTIIT